MRTLAFRSRNLASTFWSAALVWHLPLIFQASKYAYLRFRRQPSRGLILHPRPPLNSPASVQPFSRREAVVETEAPNAQSAKDVKVQKRLALENNSPSGE